MDCCGVPFTCVINPEVKERRRINKRIELEIRRSKRNLRREIKLLLLGIGESGKSTIIRQMKIINKTGFTDQEVQLYRSIIYQNVIMAMQTMVKQMDNLGIKYEKEQSQEAAATIAQIEYREVTRLNDQVLLWMNYIQALWQDGGIEKCYKRKREYNLTDSAKYFLDRLDLILSPDFTPNNDDIVHVRHPTTGINEYPIEVNDICFRIVDVGGQSSERRKWIHCFENVTSIIYVVALSEYDHVSHSDTSSRIEESRSLFRVIISHHIFVRTSFILFMNKKDLFEEKITESDLHEYFPEYNGPPRDAGPAGEFLLDQFTVVNPDRNRHIYPHFTCATDTENMRIVFECVKDTILSINLREFCLA